MSDLVSAFAAAIANAKDAETNKKEEAPLVGASDRRHPSDWDLANYHGKVGEHIAQLMRVDIFTGTCEVKHDRQAIVYGNAFIEERCQHAGSWKPSGLTTTKAETWAHVMADGLVVVWMPVWLLREVVARAGRKTGSKTQTPTEGRLVALDRLLPEALNVVRGGDRR